VGGGGRLLNREPNSWILFSEITIYSKTEFSPYKGEINVIRVTAHGHEDVQGTQFLGLVSKDG
jgi:hypothetical protein